MGKEVVFGRWESVCLMLIAICTKIFMNMPRIAAEEAGTAGWILTFYVSLISVGLLAIIFLFHRNFEGKDVIDIAQGAFGNIGRVVTGIVLVLYLVVITSVVLRGFSENIKIISLNLSPLSFVMIFFAVCMAIGAYMGIEAVVRVAAITVPVIIAGYILIVVGVLQYAEVSKITPWLGSGPQKIFVEGLRKTSFFSEGLLIILLAPFLKTNKNLRSVGYLGFGLSALFMTLSALIYLLIYQYPAANENFLPMYQLARIIYYGRFFERIESLFMIIWGITAFIYLATSMFFTVYIFQKTFALKHYRPMVIPFTILVLAVAIIPQSVMTVIKIESEYIMNYSFILTFVFGIIILATGTIIKKARKKRRITQN